MCFSPCDSKSTYLLAVTSDPPIKEIYSLHHDKLKSIVHLWCEEAYVSVAQVHRDTLLIISPGIKTIEHRGEKTITLPCITGHRMPWGVQEKKKKSARFVFAAIDRGQHYRDASLASVHSSSGWPCIFGLGELHTVAALSVKRSRDA